MQEVPQEADVCRSGWAVWAEQGCGSGHEDRKWKEEPPSAQHCCPAGMVTMLFLPEPGEQRVSLAGNGREHPVTGTATEESTFLFAEAEGDQDFLHV